MLNEKKIKLMTKLAIYEKNDGKTEIPMSKYFISDFISINMVKTAISITFAYILCVVVWLLYDLEGFINGLNEIDIFQLGKNILVLYVAVVLIYMIISYVVYRIKFKQTRESLKNYNIELKELTQILEEEGRIREEIEMGGNDEYDESFGV